MFYVKKKIYLKFMYGNLIYEGIFVIVELVQVFLINIQVDNELIQNFLRILNIYIIIMFVIEIF